MSYEHRSFGGPTLLGRASAPSIAPTPEPEPGHDHEPDAEFHAEAGAGRAVISPDLTRALSEVKGQAQFLLYLADQIEDSLGQLAAEADPGHAAFLCKVLSMYSTQLESKHQGLGDRIAEACQEVYITVRDFDFDVA